VLLRFAFEFKKPWVLANLMLEGGWQSAGETGLTKIRQSLKVFNVAMFGLFAEKGGLTING
jgi:hypothetical protein